MRAGWIGAEFASSKYHPQGSSSPSLPIPVKTMSNECPKKMTDARTRIHRATATICPNGIRRPVALPYTYPTDKRRELIMLLRMKFAMLVFITAAPNTSFYCPDTRRRESRFSSVHSTCPLSTDRSCPMKCYGRSRPKTGQASTPH